MNRPVITALFTLSACSLDVKMFDSSTEGDECNEINQELALLDAECRDGDEEACAFLEELSQESAELCVEGENGSGFEGDEDVAEDESDEDDPDEDEADEDDGSAGSDAADTAGSSGGDGETPAIEWYTGQGTDREEHVHEGHQCADGGYIAIGHHTEQGSSKTDFLIIKVDASGELEWQTTVGQAGAWDVGIAIQEVSDGYIAAGGLSEGGTQKPALVKLDFDGTVLWEKTYGGSGIGMIRGLDQLRNGNIVATGFKGYTEPGFVFIADEGEGFLMEVDLAGNVAWDQALAIMQGTKVRQTSDDGFAVLSNSWTDEDELNAMIVKTDASGTVEWSQSYGGSNNNQAFDFDVAADGSFVIAGHTTEYGSQNWDCIMTKVSPDGEEEWVRTFGQPRGYDARYIHDECYGIREHADGSFVMTGGSGNETESYSASGHPSGPASEWKSFLIKVDPNGDTLWTQIYGNSGTGNDAGEFLALTDDGGYLLFNDTDSTGEMEPNNFGFMKLMPE